MCIRDSLFRCRDNQQLLALPIPPGAIFAVRCGGVYLTGLIYLLLALSLIHILRTVARPLEVIEKNAQRLPVEGCFSSGARCV